MALTIDEAISFLESIYLDRKEQYNLGDDFPGQEALSMGIDALNRCKYIRSHPSEPRVWKLNKEKNAQQIKTNSRTSLGLSMRES